MVFPNEVMHVEVQAQCKRTQKTEAAAVLTRVICGVFTAFKCHIKSNNPVKEYSFDYSNTSQRINTVKPMCFSL